MKHIFYSTRVALILILGILTGQMSALNPLTQKLRQCSFTGPNSTFCNLNVLNQACIGGNLNVGGIITGIDGLGYGNTLIVDQVDGNDDIGAANGPRFKTISAALLQAEEGDLVLVYPGVYNETLVVPEDVIVAGVEINTVTIQQLNVTTPTDLIVLGEGSTLANLNLILTSGVDVQLRAINHISPGGSDLSAININNVRIQVTNYSAVPTTSDTIGCAFTGTSTPTVYDLIGAALMQVVSNSTGRTRGVYSEAAQYLLLNGCAINIIGGTNAIGIETTDTTTQTYCFDSLVGGTTADISQTGGTLGLSSTYLINSTANGLSFDSLIYPSFFIWADSDNPVGPGDTLYLRPGNRFCVLYSDFN